MPNAGAAGASADGRTTEMSGVRHDRLDVGDGVDCTASVFQPHPGVPAEINLTLEITMDQWFDAQIARLSEAYDRALSQIGVDRTSCVLRRVFCSDPANQLDRLQGSDLLSGTCAASLIGQAPVGPGKLALWAYHLRDPAGTLDRTLEGSTLALRRGALTHLLTCGKTHPRGDDSYTQTQDILSDYLAELEGRGLTLLDHTVRTWFFVRDVDVNYDGLVVARRELFTACGLTADTHYIASSGIGGEGTDVDAFVTMDAWAIAGLQPEQVRFLKGSDHLSRTDVYGVTFERGTVIRYRDRSHLIISGTASIDAQGQTIHLGDVDEQLVRTLENVETLLKEGGARASDMTHWIVYLRDDSDEPRVRAAMRDRYGAAPMVFVHAPVCRPGWLVEVEGIAALAHDNPGLPEF